MAGFRLERDDIWSWDTIFVLKEISIFRDILNTPKLAGCSNFSPMVGLKLNSKDNHFHRVLFILSLWKSVKKSLLKQSLFQEKTIYYQIYDIFIYKIYYISYVCKIDQFKFSQGFPFLWGTTGDPRLGFRGFPSKKFPARLLEKYRDIMIENISWELSLRVTNTNVRGFSKSRVLLIQNPYSYKTPS